MKKMVLLFSAALLLLCGVMCLGGCGTGVNPPELPDYNADIEIVLPEDIMIEHFVPKEEETYYTSPGFALWLEIKGAFFEMDYFYLDGAKRVYDDLYLYEDDYFYMLTDDMKGWYASLGDSTDTQYAEEEKEVGEDIQINIKKSGIYKIIFDTETLKFDLEFLGEIDTPRYQTMKNCSVYSASTEWVEMQENPDNPDEYYIESFAIEAGKFVSFFDRTHTSNYKVTAEESCNNKLASARDAVVTVNVGGNYNIYVNKKTYVVRLELLNPESATYSCVYYDGSEFHELTPYDVSVPYVFRQRVEVTTNYTTSLPDFHTKNYRTYDLTVLASEHLIRGTNECFFKEIGTYDIIINLKTFEISVELVAD
ncbi:MAG: hypothetical protein IKC72_04845 [Clostridia bacterium]|nr:hypothetical protein [Clostridia bacterium]